MKRRLRDNGRRDFLTLDLITYAMGVLSMLGAIGAVIALYLILGGCAITERAASYEEARSRGPAGIAEWIEMENYAKTERMKR